MADRAHIVAALLLAAACGGGDSIDSDVEAGSEEAAALDTTVTDTAAMGGPAALNIGSTEDGRRYLTDSQGRALYLFTADTQGAGSSTCAAECLQRWPPLLVEQGGQISSAAGVDSSLVGTIQRDDGSHQVTYNGWPLYYFTEDVMGGTTAGQDVHDAGGEWYLVTPEGDRLEEAGESS